jgi:4-amino-4-deoxy-L-arabinose transferase-like glycosyltransferase
MQETPDPMAVAGPAGYRSRPPPAFAWRRTLRSSSELLLLGSWAAAWLALVWVFSKSPPVDNVEELTWVRALEWGYYKHPPAPAVLLRPLVALLGLHEWVSYLAAGLVAGSALWLTRALLLRIIGRHAADLATLGTLCIGFYTGRLVYFNHDTVLMLAISIAAWYCWHAFALRSARCWTGVGLALGAGALAKYQVALTAMSVLVVWIGHQGWRDPVHRRGLARAAVLAALLFTPHLLWLATHDFQPVHYAAANSRWREMSLEQCSIGALRWVGSQLSQLAGPLLLGSVLLVRQRRRQDPGKAALPAPVDAGHAVDRGNFLFAFGLLPLATIAVLGVVPGGKLHMNWGSAFMTLTCAWLMHLTGWQRWQRVRRREALAGFALVQAVLIGVLWNTSPVGFASSGMRKTRNFASQDVADRIAPEARRLIAGPIQVIAGPPFLAGVLALRMAERPLVLIDGRYDLSPWITAGPSYYCAIVWVGEAGSAAPFESERHEIGDGLWWAVQPTSPEPHRCHSAQ